MAVISGQRRDFSKEINQGGVVTETEFEERMLILQEQINQLGGGGGTTIDGGTPTTNHNSTFKIDFGGPT